MGHNHCGSYEEISAIEPPEMLFKTDESRGTASHLTRPMPESANITMNHCVAAVMCRADPVLPSRSWPLWNLDSPRNHLISEGDWGEWSICFCNIKSRDDALRAGGLWSCHLNVVHRNVFLLNILHREGLMIERKRWQNHSRKPFWNRCYTWTLWFRSHLPGCQVSRRYSESPNAVMHEISFCCHISLYAFYEGRFIFWYCVMENLNMLSIWNKGVPPVAVGIARLSPVNLSPQSWKSTLSRDAKNYRPYDPTINGFFTSNGTT